MNTDDRACATFRHGSWTIHIHKRQAGAGCIFQCPGLKRLEAALVDGTLSSIM
ncbi:hypothetical protein ZHAS_00002649 [Anopheles sinensis]|uniref:Uncharacterized protein n=1 Tax=Anopheles sinensis TaxID=74873 RepID=A0A084VCQ3_ANOSI|nr:hypothetical protein ZHAS_00002649 [Anopheles sinensis]